MSKVEGRGSRRFWLFFGIALLMFICVATAQGRGRQQQQQKQKPAAKEESEDYYKVLGIPRSADAKEIKKGFKKMSLKHHPDKNQDNKKQAEEQFTKVVRAYEVLKDPQKKQIYDSQGEEGLKQSEQGGGGGGGGSGGFRQGGGFDDIFGQFFGGGQQHFHHQQQQQQQNQKHDLFSSSDVYEMDIGSLSKFLRRQEVWVILFYKSTQQQSIKLKDMYKDLASKYYGIFKVAAIDCAEEEELCQDQFEIYDSPSIVVYESNIRSKAQKFAGNLEDGQKIANFAVSFMESYVRKLSEKTYEEFSSENPQKHKVLLFTMKTSTPPLLRALSKDYNGKLDFGEIKNTEINLIKAFGVTDYPTLLVVTDTQTYSSIKYEGAYKKDQIVKFLREFAYASSGQNTGKVSAPQPVKLLTPEIAKNPANCGVADTKLCVVMVTQNDSISAEEAVALLKDASAQLADQKVRFYHIPRRAIELENIFDNEDFTMNFPALVVIKGKRGRFAKLEYQDTLTSSTLKNYLEDIIGGGGTFKKMHDTLAGNVFSTVINEDL